MMKYVWNISFIILLLILLNTSYEYISIPDNINDFDVGLRFFNSGSDFICPKDETTKHCLKDIIYCIQQDSIKWKQKQQSILNKLCSQGIFFFIIKLSFS